MRGLARPQGKRSVSRGSVMAGPACSQAARRRGGKEERGKMGQRLGCSPLEREGKEKSFRFLFANSKFDLGLNSSCEMILPYKVFDYFLFAHIYILLYFCKFDFDTRKLF